LSFTWCGPVLGCLYRC